MFSSVWHNEILLEPLICFVLTLSFLCILIACSLCATAVFSRFSLFFVFALDIAFFSVFLHVSLSPSHLLNWACNVIQLLLCSLLCQNFHFLRKQWPPSAGNHWFHVYRRETPLSAEYRSCCCFLLLWDNCCNIIFHSTMLPESVQW